jgi:hypothetical protein
MFTFRTELPLEARQKQSSKFLQKHPDLVPIILERHAQSTLPVPQKTKFLSPRTIKSTDLLN